jgi:hypothetical protein
MSCAVRCTLYSTHNCTVHDILALYSGVLVHLPNGGMSVHGLRYSNAMPVPQFVREDLGLGSLAARNVKLSNFKLIFQPPVAGTSGRLARVESLYTRSTDYNRVPRWAVQRTPIFVLSLSETTSADTAQCGLDHFRR